MAEVHCWYGVFVFLTIAIVALESAEPLPFIDTEPEVIGWKGDNAILPCNFSGDPYAVFWVKLNGSDLNNKENKASFFDSEFKSLDERFKMDDDFTLHIRNLQVSDEGDYLCQLEREDRSGDDKSTYLAVYANGWKPVIDQCDGSTECTFRAPPDSPSFTLDCIVTGFKPNLTTLVWSTAGRDLIPVKDDQTRLPDRTWERVVTITTNAKHGAVQNLTCTATGDAVGGTASSTITVLKFEGSPITSWMIAVICIGGMIIITNIVLITCYCRRKQRGTDEFDIALPLVNVGKQKEIYDLRRKIQNYKPGKAAGVSITSVLKVNINLFGLTGVGKSSFFNSLHCAMKGRYELLSTVGSKATGGAVTRVRTRHDLAENVGLTDNRGMKDFKLSYMDDVMAQINGERGVDPTVRVVPTPENEIHCVVYVHEYKQDNWETALKFLNKFFTDIFDHFGNYPLVIFTHKNSIRSQLRTLKSRINSYNVPMSNIFAFDNYTEEDHRQSSSKDHKLLKFIWTALKQCDLNIYHAERKRNETRDYGRFERVFRNIRNMFLRN